MIKLQPKKGQLLIAEPSLLGDIFFNRSVILLTEQNEKGTIGFILNKPTNYNINDLIPDINANFIVYNGGPVEQENLFIIHNIPQIISSSIAITSELYWGGDFELIKTLINKGKISKENIRFFLGYSGWSLNQLETEIQESAWAISKNYLLKDIFTKTSSTLWREKIIELGGDYILFSNSPENPVLN